MKKSLLVSVFAALAMMVSVNSFAQEKATKEDYKEIAKQNRKKAIRTEQTTDEQQSHP